jgi:YVTN family beta-propeller protein
MRLKSILAFSFLAACSSQHNVDLQNRAYIISRDSDDVTVIDLNELTVIADVKTRGTQGHEGMLSGDDTQLYVDSEASNETEVIDTRTLEVTARLQTPRHPTHISLTRDGKYMIAVAEADGAIFWINTATNQIETTLGGFDLPHYVRMAPDGRYAYVANLEAYHITRIDLQSRSIDAHIALDGYGVPPNQTPAPNETGFADVQIDQTTGILYAAHRATGRVLVYDTVAQKKLPELTVGTMPWIVYAEHPFAQVARRPVVPNFGDQSASVVNSQLAALPYADQHTYGVNYSPLVPDQAFLMNREKQQIAVVDTARGDLVDTIDVGGTTETASTTKDGRYIVAAVSSANAVVVIDAMTHVVLKKFFNVGQYPWSVTIPGGQNYCH